LIPAAALQAWRDHTYLLEAALEDGVQDLAGDPDAGEIREAYDHLAAAAAAAASVVLDPTALGFAPVAPG
jgi:hypothetical protein